MSDLEKKIKETNDKIRNNKLIDHYHKVVDSVVSLKSEAIKVIGDFAKQKKEFIDHIISDNKKEHEFQLYWQAKYKEYLSKYSEDLIGYSDRETGAYGLFEQSQIHTEFGPLFYTRHLKNLGDHHYERELNCYEGFFPNTEIGEFQYVYTRAIRRGMVSDGDCSITYETITRDKGGKFSRRVSTYMPNLKLENSENLSDDIYGDFADYYYVQSCAIGFNNELKEER